MSSKELELELELTAWNEWALSDKPSGWLKDLQSGELLRFYPELLALVDCPQNAKFHEEIWVWDHTLMVCDEAAKIAARENLGEEDRQVLMFSSLLHDAAKAITTVVREDGKITSYGHDIKGVPIAEKFLRRINFPEDLTERVKAIIKCHMRYRNCESDKAIKKLMRDIHPSSIVELARLNLADSRGRIAKDMPNEVPPKLQHILDTYILL